MKPILKTLLLTTSLTFMLNACSTFFDKDNTPTPTPLVGFTPTLRVQPVWNKSVGPGVGEEYLKLTPALDNGVIYTASSNGAVTATDQVSGKTRWAINANAIISSGAAAGEGKVFIGARNGDLIALNQADGTQAWRINAPSQVLAPVTVAHGVVLAKTIDGYLTAFASDSGAMRWHYKQTEPPLILRGASQPQIYQNSTITGFENGNLTRLGLQDGRVLWEETIAFPQGTFNIQRMVDVDADPIIVGNRVYAATYQGRIAALDINTGREIWTHDISSYSGIASDGNKVYVSDAKGVVWAFNANTGAVVWQQESLTARTLTGPTIMNNDVVVADAEGFVHWLDKQDGHFVARVATNNSGILATPLLNNGVLYVYTKDGRLFAYTLG